MGIGGEEARKRLESIRRELYSRIENNIGLIMRSHFKIPYLTAVETREESVPQYLRESSEYKGILYAGKLELKDSIEYSTVRNFIIYQLKKLVDELLHSETEVGEE